MRVNIEVQCLCSEILRGIPYYTIHLLDALVKRSQNEYAVSFYDYNKERNNRAFIEKYLKTEILNGLKLKECNTLSYQAILRGNETGNTSAYDKVSYEEYFGEKYDVYHLPSIQNVPRNISSKVVVTIHDMMPLMSELSVAWRDDVRAQFVNSVEFVKKRKDIQIIAVSEATKRDIIDRMDINPDRVHVTLEAYDPAIYYSDKDMTCIHNLGIYTPYILYLGALDYRKGVLDILDAFEIVKETNKELKLVLAGGFDTSGGLIKERLKNYKYIEDVILPGFVSNEQKRVLMSCAEVFLFPSEYEGFGLPVLEAMACGTPVITTNVSSLPEVGGNAAMYVTPKQPEELFFSIQKMLSSESVRQDYIARGYKQCEKFSWEKTAVETEDVYKIAYDRG